MYHVKLKVERVREKLLTNFFIIPALLSLGAIILVFTAFFLDKNIFINWLAALPWFKGLSADAASIILTTIASAAVTIASIVFSMTILILSLASNQLGPRLIPMFLKQNITQFVIGFLIATFIFNLLSIQTIHSYSASTQSFFFSVVISILLGIVCLFLFIYFVHYVCSVIQIDNMLGVLFVGLKDAISRFDKNNLILEEEAGAKEKSQNPIEFTHIILSTQGGYIETMNYKEIYRVACDNDCVIHCIKKPGEYLIQNTPLYETDKKLADNVKKELRGAVTVRFTRTGIQDVEFTFEQFSEIALRALSPSLNNPFTAISCINHIFSGITLLNETESPKKKYYQKDQLRLIIKTLSYQSIINTALDQIRQNGASYVSIIICLLQCIDTILHIELKKEIRQSLLEQYVAIKSNPKLLELSCKDKNDIFPIMDRLKEKLT